MRGAISSGGAGGDPAVLRGGKVLLGSRHMRASLSDILQGIGMWRLWLVLGWRDIQYRYRRSVLGPIWLTLSMSLAIYTLGFLYGHLLRVDLSEYLPHVATGMSIWSFISSTILEESDAFVECGHYIKQVKLPFTVYILRVFVRNAIVFGHNFVALIPLFFYYRIAIAPFAALFGFLFVGLCCCLYGAIFALLGARFRDFRPILQNVIHLLFYATPVMWMPRMLPESFLPLIRYNPLCQLVELVRSPLLGRNVQVAWSALSIFCAIGAAGMVTTWVRARHRIALWV